ncbi:hypothetical protein LSTR_LSTR012772 [Laodelphax striatellus]|uniref:Uncharacterized protein n=1 Tax=Laodelphax striatellus TaxID=195883 RepID=A0A482X5V4_LAOST|nr:hypothetical protein LSTR_LSTR012772 [Laodelphax striatellus]
MYRLKTFCLALSVQAGLVVLSAVFMLLSVAIILSNWPDFDWDSFATKAVIIWILLLIITAVLLVVVAYTENWIAALVSVVLMTVVILFWCFVSLPPLLERVDKNYVEGRDYEIDSDTNMKKFSGFDGKNIGATDVRRLLQKDYCIKLRCGETMWLMDMGWRTMYTDWSESLLKVVADEKKRRVSIKQHIAKKPVPIMNSYRRNNKPVKMFAEYKLIHYNKFDYADPKAHFTALMPMLTEHNKNGTMGSNYISYVSGYGLPCRFVKAPTTTTTRKPTTTTTTPTSTTTTTTTRPTTRRTRPTQGPGGQGGKGKPDKKPKPPKGGVPPDIDYGVLSQNLIFPMKNLNYNYYSQTVSAVIFAGFFATFVYFWLIVVSAFIVLG